MPERPTNADPVERVRELLELGDRGDWDAAMDFFAPGAVWVAIDSLESFEGAAIRQFWVDWYRAYEDVRIETVQITGLGEGVVVAAIHQTGRLGDGLSRIHQDAVLVYEWSDGLIERVTTYIDAEEARAAGEQLAAERARTAR